MVPGSRASTSRFDGGIVRWYVLLTDIDDLKGAEALLAGEKRLLEMVASGSPLPMILDALCVLVEETASGCHCSILLIDPTGTVVQHGAAPSLPSSYNEAMHGRPVHPEAGPCGMAACLKTQVIASDVAADTRWDAFGWRALAVAHDLKSCWSTPVLSLTGSVLGTFAIYRHEAGSRPHYTVHSSSGSPTSRASRSNVQSAKANRDGPMPRSGR